MKLLCRLGAAFLLLTGLAFGQAAAFLPPPPLFCWSDANGAPLVGGKVGVFLAGSSTPTNSYTDSTAGGTNTNPVILDSSGCHAIWVSAGSFKFVVSDANDVVLFTTDNIPGGLGSVWGAITGTITDQADLVAALALKLNTSQLDTDGTLAANSDAKIPSQKAVKTYAVPKTLTLTTTSPIVCDSGASCDLSANRTLGFGTKAKNLVLAGPTTGADAAPDFRALVAADIPALSAQGLKAVKISSTCTTASGTSYVNCTDTLTWPTAWADTNYVPVCSGKVTLAGDDTTQAPNLVIQSYSTTQIVVSTQTERSIAAHFAEILCIGTHL